jgi:hypothetical protein
MLSLHLKKAKLYVVLLQIPLHGSFKTFWDRRKYSDNIIGRLKSAHACQDTYNLHSTTAD